MAEDKGSVLKQLEKDLRWWVDRESKEGSFSFRRRTALKDGLDGHETRNLVAAGSAAQRLSVFEIGLGSVQVLDGDPSGWGRLSNAASYYYLFQRISHEHDKSIGKLYTGFLYSVHWFLHMFCLMAALGREAEARWLGQEALAFFEHGLVQEYSNDIPYQGYMRALASGYVNRHWPHPSLGDESPYEGLFGSQGGGNIADVIRRVCDRHLETAVEGEDESGSDRAFTEVGFTILPVEILAYSRLREVCEKPPLPDVEHPLLATPLAAVPKVIPVLEDELLTRLTMRVLS